MLVFFLAKRAFVEASHFQESRGAGVKG